MKGKLILQDGTIFHGQLFGGSNVTADGEVVFNTGMTGYQEILTDPSYCKQIVTLTYPIIGNYGTAKKFNQSRKSFVSGLVIGELCVNPSSSSMEKTLPEFLTAGKIPYLYDVDTRALTKKVSYTLDAGNNAFNVVAMDFGIKRNILDTLRKLNCRVTVVPAKTTAEEILALNPDGIFLLNGPGDPKIVLQAADEILVVFKLGVNRHIRKILSQQENNFVQGHGSA